FVQNVFRKISKRARKAVRSVLPVFIPSNLVGLSVNGVLILPLLWVLTAFLELFTVGMFCEPISNFQLVIYSGRVDMVSLIALR
ncbi:hypothetical protein Goari_000406, partial [Gossypium aridum]|nr:hypothetical protein [Gossypium aridum]